MSKAGDLVARMDRLGQAAVPTPPAAPPSSLALQPPPPPGGGGTPPRPRSGGGRRRRVAGTGAVRVTVDLEQTLHRALRLYALDHQVDASEVMRVLLELLDEPTVAELVAGRLAVSVEPEPLTGLIHPEQRSHSTSMHDPPNGLSGKATATHRTPP